MDNRSKTIVEIYTDGACLGNPGPGGYGVVLKYKDNLKEISGGADQTTNNRMELTAAIEGLRALKKSCEVILYSDSKYLVDSIEKGWAERWEKAGWMRNKREKALNYDLWEELLSLIKIHQVKFVWVKGHSGNPLNERCDQLAVAEANRIKNSRK